MAQRVDPYKNFKFRVQWDGRVVAGVSKVSGLKRTTFAALTLERGVTHDREFEQWANGFWKRDGAGSGTALDALKRDLRIEVYDEAGRLAQAYKVRRCWVSEFTALPDLDASAGAIAIEHLRLENEGWQREERHP